jgi:hypothetical protein
MLSLLSTDIMTFHKNCSDLFKWLVGQAEQRSALPEFFLAISAVPPYKINTLSFTLSFQKIGTVVDQPSSFHKKK